MLPLTSSAVSLECLSLSFAKFGVMRDTYAGLHGLAYELARRCREHEHVVFETLVLYFRPEAHIKRLGPYKDRVRKRVHQCMASMKGVDVEVVVKWLDCIGRSMMARNLRHSPLILCADWPDDHHQEPDVEDPFVVR